MNGSYLIKCLISLIFLYMSYHCCLCYEITHEDIKDAMLNLAHIMRENTEKLERHEFRDRQMDEQLRKALMLITRKIQLIDNFKYQFEQINGKIETVEQLFIKTNTDVTISYTKLAENIDSHFENSSISCSYKDNSTTLSLEPLRKMFEIENNFNETWKTLVKSDDDLKMIWLKNFTNLDERYQSNTDEIKSFIHNSSMNIKAQCDKIDDDLKILTEGQSIMITIADHVLEMKKEFEDGNHQLSAKIEFILSLQSEQVGMSLAKSFLELEKNLVINYDKLLGNISDKIEIETNPVWRQINIMSQQIIHNSETLSKLKNSSEAFINETTLIIDSLAAKVDLILKKIPEIDEKINFFFGKLSLLMQEFNQITIILKNSLNSINSP